VEREAARMTREMTNKETKEEILRWLEKPRGIFSWPTDACGYEQHMKFVKHRNDNWQGSTKINEDFAQFVRDYALSLEGD
jgi:hypothetical protein